MIIAALLGFVLILAGGALLYFLNSPALRFESDFDQGRTEELPDLYNRKIRGRPIEENLLRLRMNGKAEKLAEDYLLRRSDYETTVRKLSVLQEIPLYFLENEIESSLLDIEKRHRKETGEEEAANAGEQVPGDAEDTDAPAEDTGASDAPEESTEPTEEAAETVTETEAPEETEAAATETETEKATEKPTEKETEKPTE